MPTKNKPKISFEAEEPKKKPKRTIYICKALINRRAHMHNVDYKFRAGETYELENFETMQKLTHPLNGTLELLETKEV